VPGRVPGRGPRPAGRSAGPLAAPARPGWLGSLPGYDAINSVLRDPGFRVSDESSLDRDFPGWPENPVFVQGADWILNLNAPRHLRIRSLIARAFTPRRIAGLEPAIAKMADELLDAMADRGADGGAIEFMHDFAYLLPVTVICELIGIPEADREGFRPVARDLAGVFELNDIETLPAINAAAVELLAYFTGLAASRRAEPHDDLLSDLLAVSNAGDGRLTDAELLHNLTLLLVAGLETTTNLLGNGLQVTLQDPSAGEAVRDGSVPPAAFVEEVLRFDSPVQLTSRSATTRTWAACRCPRDPGWSRCSGRATGIRAGSPTRLASTRGARTAGRSASAAARISASAPRSPGSRAQWHSPGC
jgi:cytochrome P450